MKSTAVCCAGALLSLVPTCLAWGDLGHMTVAYIAQNYLTSDTVSWAQNILGDTSDAYLANVATWADTYRYTSEGSFSEPFHFIDANDNPPSSCSVEFNRDCGAGGCVVTALMNYTQRVQDTSLSSEDQYEALKFVVHFLGDVTQPLHDENYEVGGNDIDVTFDGTSTNLHHIWDTNMPEKLVGGYSSSDASQWASELIQEIDSGDYSSEKSSWISMINLNDVQDSVTSMAQDANAYVCSYTLKPGVSKLENEDLGGSYYTDAVPIFSEQIAKGGYRLAAWLNTIVTGSNGMS